MILETEYELMLTHLEVRSGLENFSIEDVKQELEHLLIFQGQDWVGRGELKNAEIQGHIYAYEVFLKRWRDRHEQGSSEPEA
ncbi:MAG TPA: hypothetical protein VKZ39_04870 [Sphaerochaetaceae bacterium]|jgi:hypothetical protein|nr:hypothetical protein [Sphaerochaetaceae bacterium]